MSELAKSSRSRLRRLMLAVALAVVALAAVAVWWLLRESSESIPGADAAGVDLAHATGVELDDAVARYDAFVVAHRAREYPRAAIASGPAIEPGSAAERYRAAVAGCELPRATLEPVLELSRLLAGRLEAASPDGASCRPRLTAALAGDSARLAHVEAACAALEQCDAAIDHWLEGSRRADARSPYDLWHPWSIDRSGARIFDLLRLATLRSYLRDPDATRGERLGTLLALLRSSSDLPRGAMLVHHMVAIGFEGIVLDTLAELLEAGAFDAAALERLLAALVEHDRTRPHILDTLETELTLQLGLWLSLAGAELELPPAMARDLERAPVSLRDPERLGALVTHSVAWAPLLAADRERLGARLTHYEALERDAREGEPGELAGALAERYVRYDLDASLAHLDARLFTWLVAAHLHVARRGAPPEDLDALSVLVPASLRLEPLSGTPLEVQKTADAWLVQAAPESDVREVVSELHDAASLVRRMPLEPPAAPR